MALTIDGERECLVCGSGAHVELRADCPLCHGDSVWCDTCGQVECECGEGAPAYCRRCGGEGALVSCPAATTRKAA